MVKEFVERAKRGESVYITELHAAFVSLPVGERERLALLLETLDGKGLRRFDLSLPRLEGLQADEVAFIESYLSAELYNILSALGGRRLTVCRAAGRPLLDALLARLPAAFGIGQPRAERRGYARAINVIDRMLGAMAPGSPPFSIAVGDLEAVPRAIVPERRKVDTLAFFRGKTLGLEGRAFAGIDVGGTDIKAVLVDDGRIVDFKEYDWFPANFQRSKQLVEPVLLIVELLRARLWVECLPPGELRAKLGRIAARGLDRRAGEVEMRAAIDELNRAGLDLDLRFDAIGLCFPDVVVKDKIVGGEVYKTRGIRNNPTIDYESDFAELTHLDLRLREWVGLGGKVRIVNDGPMASFTAAVEMAASPEAETLSHGVFAHTLGTELGTGWIDEDGTIPDIPLEVYNFVIDLGSWPERAHEADDLRSLNNFNTGIAGTLQKYSSQSGVFRLALKYFPGERPDLFRELIEKGFVERRTRGGTEGFYVPTEPVDLRKPFLEHIMTLLGRESDETNRKIWRELGESLGVTLLETRRILEPATDERFLFGRLVKDRGCFDLMVEGARRIVPNASFAVAGTGMANTPLMRQLEANPDYTVAQFAQAIGAVYFANG